MKTKKKYEEYLNENSPSQGSDEWIIGGTIRVSNMTYGTAIRNIAFEVGYNEWKSF